MTQRLDTVSELLRVVDVLRGRTLLRDDASAAEEEHADEEVSLRVGVPPVIDQTKREYHVAPDMCYRLEDRQELQKGGNIFRAATDTDTVFHDEQLRLAFAVNVPAGSLQLSPDPRANELLVVLRLMEASWAMLDAIFELAIELVPTLTALRPLTMLEAVQPLTGVGLTILEGSGALAVQFTVLVGLTFLCDDYALEGSRRVVSIGNWLLVVVGVELVVRPHLLRIHHHLLLHSDVLILHIVAHVL